jgi:hypothetical protein
VAASQHMPEIMHLRCTEGSTQQAAQAGWSVALLAVAAPQNLGLYLDSLAT